MTETVLVTGATGFVAGWCIVELLQRGYAVRTTVRSLSKEPAVRAAVAFVTDVGNALTLFAADLTRDEGWDAAMAGCDYVLHVASPLGNEGSSDADALIVPARDGTLRVLRAANKARVRRVVMTSSCAAAASRMQGPDSVNDESVWTDASDPDLNAYRLSKLFAERAAWEFMAANSATDRLTTILPSAVFGPVLTRDNLGSVQIIQRMADGRMPAIPRVGMCIVDVRDLADLHIRAMLAPAAAGQRFIAAGDFMWMKEIARTLRSGLGERARKVPTRNMPDIMLRIIARFVPALRSLIPMLGRKHIYNSARARHVLGFAPRAATQTVLDCARSLGADYPPGA
jgi:dihydroflavonol-4-reductase